MQPLSNSSLSRAFVDHSGATQPVSVSTIHQYLEREQLTKNDSIDMRRLVYTLLNTHIDICLIDVNSMPDDNVLLELGIARSFLYLLNPIPVEKIRELLVKAEQLNFMLQICFEV